MDALLLKAGWKHSGGFDMVDSIKELAKELVPDWKEVWVTKTYWQGANSRFVTPFPHPVAKYGPGKKLVYNVGKEIEGHEGVFPLTYKEGVPDEFRKELSEKA